MVYVIVVNHRHKTATKTLVQGDDELLSCLNERLEKTREFTDPVTGARKLQIEDEPLYNVFNHMEVAGWSLINGFSAGTAEQYIFHHKRLASGSTVAMSVAPPPPAETEKA